MRLVLASASPARRMLLESAGLAFTAEAAPVDEEHIRLAARAEGLSAADTAILLADAKAARVARRHPDAAVIGADQILVEGGEWLGKPPDLDAARAQLRRLRGRAHALVTAVVVWRDGGHAWQHVATPRLVMRPFSDAFLEDYLQREAAHATQTVGPYRIEGPGIQLMREVQGEHGAILGLPMLPLLDYLRASGVIAG